VNKRISVSAIVVAVVLVANTAHGQVYNVVPIDLGNGYSIATGSTMTAVDGEISDWSITVDGDHPHTFSSPADGLFTFAFFENVIITEDSISVMLGPSDQNYVAFQSDLIECDAENGCEASLYWGWTSQASVSFRHLGRVSGGGPNPDFSDDGDFLFVVLTESPLPEDTVVIAFASQQVPEPTTGVLATMAVFCLLGISRRRSR